MCYFFLAPAWLRAIEPTNPSMSPNLKTAFAGTALLSRKPADWSCSLQNSRSPQPLAHGISFFSVSLDLQTATMTSGFSSCEAQVVNIAASPGTRTR
jgi:hypothetical protein